MHQRSSLPFHPPARPGGESRRVCLLAEFKLFIDNVELVDKLFRLVNNVLDVAFKLERNVALSLTVE